MKNENKIKLQVIVPSYNHEKFIKECIESIVNQTEKNFELQVVDDGSTDRSVWIIRSLSEKYGFFFKPKENEGLVKTLNKTINDLSDDVEYVSILASDDIMLEKRVKIFNEIYKKNDLKNIGAVFTGYVLIDENGKEINRKTYEKAMILDSSNYFGKRWLAAPTAFLNVKALKSVGGYSEKYSLDDYYLWHKLLAANYNILVIPDITVKIRKHSNNMSGKKVKMLVQEIKILSEYGLKKRVIVAIIRSIISYAFTIIRR